MPATPPTAVAPARVLAVDVLRGLTIGFMILVNDPGDGRVSYSQLQHAEWNGCTMTDLVFPTFLFLVGVSTILSLSGRLARGDSKASLALKVIRRAALIFLIDLTIAAIPHFHLGQLRIFGVLTRIALCYLVVGLLCLVTRRAAVLASIAAAALLVYWVLMRFVPVPGYGVPTHSIPLLDPDANLVAWCDRGINAWMQRTLHTGHLYEGTRDPEGLISTIPAIATTLFGALTALWMRRVETVPELRRANSITREQCLRGMLIASAICLVLGRVWNIIFPINKKLWTSSYVLFAGGCSLLGLALCYWVLDVARLQHRSRIARAAVWPWIVFGTNAITAYAISEVAVELLSDIRVPDAASRTGYIGALGWAYRHIFTLGGASTANTSLAFAIAYVIACFIPVWLLWRRQIFLRV